MNIVFLGTPEFAVDALKSIKNSSHKILCVVSQPDRMTDKKGNLLKTPIKQAAEELNLKVYQFESVSKQGVQILKELNPDIMVTCAFGQMLSQEFLNIAKHGTINIHASLLPKYRGSSPIQASILNGDTKTGVTIMQTVLKMDAGDILLQQETPIDDTTDFITLSNTLSKMGAELVVKALDLIESGKAEFKPQNEQLVTHVKKISKADGIIDFNDTAFNIVRKINAFNPWPAAYTFHNGNNIKIFAAEKIDKNEQLLIQNQNLKSGQIIAADNNNGLIIKCGDGAIKVLTLQAPGKKRLDVKEFLRGYSFTVGETFSDGK